jgi:hypothetical protein
MSWRATRRSGLAALAALCLVGCFDYEAEQPAHGEPPDTPSDAAAEVADASDPGGGEVAPETADDADATPADSEPPPDTAADLGPMDAPDAGPDDVADAGDAADSAAEGDTTIAPVTFDLVHAFLVVKCDPCHSGPSAATSEGEHDMANPDVDVAYAASQLASSAPGLTKGALGLRYVRQGIMPLGVGCTGTPADDAAKPDCLTAGELDRLTRWVTDGQLPPAPR